jgi:hypothetical protein
MIFWHLVYFSVLLLFVFSALLCFAILNLLSPFIRYILLCFQLFLLCFIILLFPFIHFIFVVRSFAWCYQDWRIHRLNKIVSQRERWRVYLIYYVFLRIKQWWIFADLNAKSKPRNVILISGVMNLGCPSATIWVGLLTFFWPPNALQYGCLAVQ